MVSPFVSIAFLSILAFALGYLNRTARTVEISDSSRSYRIVRSLALAKRLGFLISVCILATYGIFRMDAPLVVTNSRNVVVVDVSASMLVADADGKSRLERAKDLVLGKFFPLVSPIAIVAFKGDASVIVPTTLDAEYAKNGLLGLSPDSASGKGSGIAEWVAFAYSLCRSDEYADVYFLSDGDDRGIDTTAIKTLVKSHPNVRFHAIGVGSETGGKIPVGTSPLGETIFMKRPDGSEIVSALNRKNMALLASVTGGDYHGAESFGNPFGNVSVQGNAVTDWTIRSAALFLLASMVLPYRFRKLPWKNA